MGKQAQSSQQALKLIGGDIELGQLCEILDLIRQKLQLALVDIKNLFQTNTIQGRSKNRKQPQM